jgi:hypothetical protein
MPLLIKALFANPRIDRRMEEVIKVDQTSDEILREELEEYVVTQAIGSHYAGILEVYRETPNKPHEGVGVWISGFFGSGKSSFAKMLGFAIENRLIAGQPAAERFAARAGDNRISVLLKTINEQIPTHVVMFDVSTDRGIRSGNQTLTEIMYGLFLHSLGYAKDLDLSELEITLEEKGQIRQFEDEYARLYAGKSWNAEKGKIAFALGEASNVIHHLDPATYPHADSWIKAVKNKADITPGKLAERATELMKRRCPGRSLLFVIDEVGQFVARDVQKMLDLQGVIQNLGIRGRGKHWLVVTSQEKLGEVVSGLDDKKIELARLMDRFPQQVHLEPSDISEVTSRRVLAKNAPAQAALGKLFDDHRGRLTENTRLTADIKLPEINRQNFIDLYPLLPYQVDLIIQVVSGLRTQGGASRHVGGANRTIIKLAQQLLINPAVNLAEQPVGRLARLDQVYDLVEGNIGSEIRAKISALSKEIEHPLAQAVAKVICLLQFVKSVHRTAANIAAALYSDVAADSQLAPVKEALRQLEAAHQVRCGEDGYRIPTPAEDDWERVRSGMHPKPGDAHRLYSETLLSFWQPQPSCTLFDTKSFKAGLVIRGRDAVDGDIMFHLHWAEEGQEYQELSAELRARSQQEPKNVFWAVRVNSGIDREMVELFRSREIVARREREARGDETALVAEEKARLRGHQEELRRLLRSSCLTGNVYFRGNDRSPGEDATDPGKSAAHILEEVLPDVFQRFQEAAARPGDVKRGVEAILSAENLKGLPPVFSTLGLLRDEAGQIVFRVEGGPLAEALGRIAERANYGDTASGRWLAEEFAKEPFGWDFEVVRLLALSLLRAGKVEAVSRGQTLESVSGAEARSVFSNNNLFRQASFRPKKGIEFRELVKAAGAFRETFGAEVKEINAATIVAELRKEITRHEDTVAGALALLSARRLPGGGVLEGAVEHLKVILRGSEDNAIAAFNASHRTIKDAIKRAAEIEERLVEPALETLDRARRAMSVAWPFLRTEDGLREAVSSQAEALQDALARETFFRELPAIEQYTKALEDEYERRYNDALQARMDAYAAAHQQLTKTEGWAGLQEESRRAIAEPLLRGARRDVTPVPIPQLRSERDACATRLRVAILEVQRLVDGERLATVSVNGYFSSGIETEEQLDAALAGLREECLKLIGAGKKVILG